MPYFIVINFVFTCVLKPQFIIIIFVLHTQMSFKNEKNI